jgi:hypothetical protein
MLKVPAVSAAEYAPARGVDSEETTMNDTTIESSAVDDEVQGYFTLIELGHGLTLAAVDRSIIAILSPAVPLAPAGGLTCRKAGKEQQEY